MGKKTEIRQEITKIQLRYTKNLQSFINFNGKLAKSMYHPSEITKRSTGNQEAPALLGKKTAFWKEKTKIQLSIAKIPQATIDFNGELAKSTHHPSEKPKRSTDR
ncbi:MAG: hypothetical protein MR487_04190 [Lachnospiraceae bacterium]|nr:hypothetical protein [Lachnospiraceae bacterium]